MLKIEKRRIHGHERQLYQSQPPRASRARSQIIVLYITIQLHDSLSPLSLSLSANVIRMHNAPLIYRPLPSSPHTLPYTSLRNIRTTHTRTLYSISKS